MIKTVTEFKNKNQTIHYCLIASELPKVIVVVHNISNYIFYLFISIKSFQNKIVSVFKIKRYIVGYYL